MKERYWATTNNDTTNFTKREQFRLNTVIATIGQYIGKTYSARSILKVIESKCPFDGVHVTMKQIAIFLFYYFQVSQILEGSGPGNKVD